MACRVLIVEDDFDSRQALAALLGMWGFDVADAGTGAEAIAQAACFPPDIAMIDLELPDLDGCEVARSLLNMLMPKAPFLIALTGHAESHFKEAADAAGFDLFAVKPWDIEQMRSVLSAWRTARRLTSTR